MGSENLLQQQKVNSISIPNMSSLLFRKPPKPQSLPNRWPHSTDAEKAERPSRIIKIGQEQEFTFRNNFVKTSKYEYWNFLPKFLFEEFNPRSKVANCYFLLISGLQCIPDISNTAGYPTTLLPLFVIVMVDGIFAMLEDMNRHKADAAANSSITKVYNSAMQDFEDVAWSNLAVGDFVFINTRTVIPADIVVICVAEKSDIPQGICFVETKSLDGETNLKRRNALPTTFHKFHEATAIKELRGEIEMEHPNKLIDSFTGVIDLEGLGREAIQPSNILLRGCVLRNTDWVIGLVVNTGHDTKIMMSSTETPSKISNLEVRASMEIVRIVMLLALICMTGATGQTIWNSINDVSEIWYLRWDPDASSQWIIQFFYFFLLHATFIPVSLYVSMTVTRFFQSYFMNNDLEMYYEKTDHPSAVRTMTLNEELGQISHIFSDKTGTLTCNVMDFRKCSINGVVYGVGITEIGKASWKLQGKEIPADVLQGEEHAKANAVPHVSFYCPQYEHDTKNDGPQREKIRQFFRIIALCHDVIPERVGNRVKLSASNPDDEALVCAAAYFGFEFKDRQDKVAIINNRDYKRDEKIELLDTIEFTSKRKRMSVIIRDTDNAIRILTKGADTAMMERLHPGQDSLLANTDDQMRQFSSEGLRCLLIGHTEISLEEYTKWSKKYRDACTDLVQLDLKKRGEANKIEDLQDRIEQNLTLLGATALEDRLQDGVPECIAQLALAGINIWVLTGDKEETAINIAVACNLVLPKEYMDHIIINKGTAGSGDRMQQILQDETKRFDFEMEKDPSTVRPRALIIDGPSLITAMADVEKGGVRECLLEFGKRCRAVVGCRVSPDQKREMVNLIKMGVPGVRTLSIGDGANDVAMIQEAHVGVGIIGEEGLQAVNASDFSIAQFRYLSVLLLKHGRFNYIRMSKLVLYMFYKNILMSICQHWYSYNNGFSGQKIYPEAGIQMFNLIFTSIPILLLGVYDMDVTGKATKKFPQLYLPCLRDEFFKSSLFWKWIMNSVLDALFISFISPMILEKSQPGYGALNSYLEAGALIFTTVVIVANTKMIFIQCRWTLWHVSVILLSIASWWTIAAIWTTYFISFDPDWYKIWNYLMVNGSFWMGLWIMVTALFCKDLYFSALERDVHPKPHHIVQEVREGKGGENGISHDDVANNKKIE